ncbi:MAG: phage major capsid protein [Xanthomonadaceae bacterium]|jgi:HK97 family phage major capsid protein|nr:phage major capsid protein [Xanthomonadaceae bacterium]
MSHALEMHYERKVRELAEVERALGAREKDRISLGNALDALRHGKPDLASRERDYSESLQYAHNLPPLGAHSMYFSWRGIAACLGDGILPRGRRDLGTTPTSAGGALVTTQLHDEIADALRPFSAAYRLGATSVPLTGGQVGVPRINTTTTGAWLGSETTPAPESQPVLGQIALSPKTAATYVESSRQLRIQSGQAGERMIALDLMRAVGSLVDVAVFAGSGASGQPLGLANTAGVTAISGGTLNRGGLLELQRRVAAANGITNAATIGYATTPQVAEILANRAVVASSDVSAWQGNLAEGTAAGALAVTSTGVPAGVVAFGDWSQCLVASWGVLRIEVNPTANFPAGVVGYRAFLDADVGFRQTGSFCLATATT